MSFDASNRQIGIGNTNRAKEKQGLKNKHIFFPNRLVLSLCVNVGECGYTGIFLNTVLLCPLLIKFKFVKLEFME